MSLKSKMLEELTEQDKHKLFAENNSFYLAVKSEEKLRKILTKRETEIIRLVSRGLHNKEIASVLGISVRTVEFHVSNILLKLEVSTRLEAVFKWVMWDKLA
ncbi:LuxR C-terminal-related transcriptional regulator [Desulfosporosinus sp. FKA]|uniref:LuxR C-terminal-related transcriptional regulator n=1 Tax=Desulfosporosinus sp. FKA TaxID=1969834 RepID=UPI000B4A38DE